jgi:exosome complex RNA-binding protein Rrp42 (RNase PH superfamily)
VAVEVSQPKASRPAEGAVHIDVELSPMAAAHFSTLNRYVA